MVAGEAAYTLKIRSGCAGGGKGALVQTEKTGTLSTLQDQTLFQPIVFDARGNGNGKTVPTITGDHESRVTDYTAIAVDLYNGAVTGSKAAALSCKNTGTTAGPQVAERKTYSEKKMKEKRLVDANHFMQVLKNIEYALKGELTHGKIKTSVVQMIEGSLNAEPTIAPESLQPLTYNENRDYIDCDEFICHKCGIHVEDWKQIKIDPDDGEKELCEYTFKHGPE